MSRTLDDIQGNTPKPRAQAKREREPVQPSTGLTPPEGDVATQSQQTQPAGQQVQGAVQGAPAGQPQEPPKPTQQDHMTFTEDQLKDGGKSEGVKMEEEAAKTGGATGAAPGAASSIPIMTEGYEQYLRNLERLEEQKRDRLVEDKERLKRQQLFATIGDGLSAFHEAYNNTRGIKPITSGKSMTGKWQERYDKLMSDIDKSDLASAKNRLDTAYKGMRLRQMQQQQDRLDRVAIASAEEKAAKIEKFKSEEDIKRAESEVKIQLMQAGIEEKKASAQAKMIIANSQAYKNYAQGDKAKNGGSGSGGGSKGGGGGRGSGSLSNNPNYKKVVVTDKKTGTKTYSWEKIDDGSSAGTGAGSTGKGKGKGYGSKGKGKGKGY